MTEEKKQLTEQYKQIFGKRPFAGWSEDQLLEKILQADTAETNQSSSVIDNEDIDQSSMDKFCHNLWKQVTNGALRAAILRAREECNSIEEVKNRLLADDGFKRDGNAMAVVKRA